MSSHFSYWGGGRRPSSPPPSPLSTPLINDTPHLHHRNPNTDTLLITDTTLIHSTSAAVDTMPEQCVQSCTHHNHTSSVPHTSIAVNVAPSHSLSIHTFNTNNSIQSQQPPHPHRVPRRHTKDDHMTTDTTQEHRHSRKRGCNLIILQVNIKGIKNKLEELKLLIHDTHAYIITIQEIMLTPKANTFKVYNYIIVRAYRLHSLETTLHLLQQTYHRPSIHTTHNFIGIIIRIRMILFRKYKCKWCNKNELQIYNVEINLRGDYIMAIKMPLSCGHPLFN